MNQLVWPKVPTGLVILPLFIVGFWLLRTNETAASPQADFLTAVQITDHALTGEDTMYIGRFLSSAIGRNSAHVVWREQNSGNMGTDLFYHRLPNGNTQRLSNIAAANNAGVFFQAMRISSSDTPHITWEEYSGTLDSRDIYYWNPIDGTISLISQAPASGFVQFRSEVWLEGNDYHIVWQQLDATQTEDIFVYWNSVSKTAVELPGFEAGLLHNGVLHITWDGEFNGPVYYWNSSDQMTVTVPNSSTVGDASVHQRGIFKDSAGQVTIFFGFHSLGDPVTTCLASWNNNTQTTTVHVTTSQCFSLDDVQQDQQGVFHAFGVDDTADFLPYYWNSDLPSAIFFDVSAAGTGNGIPGGDIYVSEGGKVHILWEDASDLFYWNPTDQQVINLSASSGPNTIISSTSKFRRFDAAGNLHVIWQEQPSSGLPTAPFYWHSLEKVSLNLLTKFGLNSMEKQAMQSSSDSNPIYMFYGTPTVGDAGAFYWDIIDDSVTQVWTGSNNNTLFSYEDEPAGDVLTAWIDQTDYSLVINSLAKGSQVMNQTAADDTDNLVTFIGYDDFDNIYAIWTEMSDSSGEGLDFFAAWSTDFIEGTTDLFLPVVTR